MSPVPDPQSVRTRTDFIGFVAAMEASLGAALLEPEPSPYEDARGGWTNWANRWTFSWAMTAWLADTGRSGLIGEPIGEVLLASGSEPSAEHWRDPESLHAFLVAVREWAEGPTPDGPPDMWLRAAEAMCAGAVYE